MKRKIAEIIRTACKNSLVCLIHRLSEKQAKQRQKPGVIQRPHAFRKIRSLQLPYRTCTIVIKQFSPRAADDQQNRQQCEDQRDCYAPGTKTGTKSDHETYGPEHSRANNAARR